MTVPVPDTYPVVVAAGSLRCDAPAAWRLPHRWTDEGVTVEASFTGAHMLHVAVAGCVLNDLYREAVGLGVELAGARVSAQSRYDDAWSSTGVTYTVEVDTGAPDEQVRRLLAAVDAVAEVPRMLRAGAVVQRRA